MRRATGGLGRNARSNFWTRPWTLVNVPSFSASEAAGRTTSAARVRALRVARGDGEEARLAQDRDLLGVVGERGEAGVRDEDDLGRRLAREHGVEAVAVRSRARGPCRARRGSSRRRRRPRSSRSSTSSCAARDLSTTTSRFGQARWSASLRSRKFSSFERCAEPRKKRPAGPSLSIVGADLARRSARSRPGTMASRTSVALADRRLVDVPRVQRSRRGTARSRRASSR